MLARRPETNRDEKRDDGSETNPPREFHHRQPRRLFVEFCAEDSGDVVRQSAQDRHDDEAGHHGDDVAAIVAAHFREHSAKENAEERAVGVAENAEDDRDDADLWIHDDEIRCGRGHDDHEHREPDRGPAHRAETLFLGRGRIDVGLIPIARETGSERVQRGAERTHGGGENSGDE